MSRVDSITIQVISTNLSGIVQEMQQSLFRTGYSTIIRESQDASCAILDKYGRVVSQHVVLPLHTGAFPATIQGLLERYKYEDIYEGDAFLVNHPYYGGSPHASDMAIVTPVFYQGELVGFCANIAHKSDIGGTVPGSGSGSAREIYHEGLHLPPIRYIHRYKPIVELEQVIRSNSRTPELVIGDINGQIGANRVGERRLAELIAKFNLDTVLAVYDELFDYTEKKIREELKKWPDGVYKGEGWIDNDGILLDQKIRIAVSIEKTGDRILFDFTASDPQSIGPANIRPPLVKAACYYCLIAWIDPQLPINDGLARVVETKFASRSVLNPEMPAPVNSYISTAHIVVESVLAALGHNVPGKQIAGSCGSGAIILGGGGGKDGNRKQYVQYEIFGGGMGARSGRDGVSGTTVHVSNGRTAPIEIIESEFPVEVVRFELLQDSCGAGEFRGGLGYVREYRILDRETRCSMRSDKHEVPPFGALKGRNAQAAGLIINPETAEEKRMPSRFGDARLKYGDVVRVVRPGGGGLGDPLLRLPQKVLEDVLDGYISKDAALHEYGVALVCENDAWRVDEQETAKLRASKAAVLA